MGWLGKLFGGAATIEGLRKAVAQKRFAEAKLLAEQLLEQPLAAVDTAEVEKLQVVAGNSLARLNLDEALGFQRSGESELAREHFQLAEELACSTALREEIKKAAAEPLVPTVEPAEAKQSSAACNSCSQPSEDLPAEAEQVLPDLDTQFELILTSYPADLAERYRQKPEQFQEAFFLAHAGEDETALPLWRKLSVAEQDDLYWFELGATLARLGKFKEARSALEKALQNNAELLLATEALVPVLISLKQGDVARKRLQGMLEQGQSPAFCHAQLTMLSLREQKREAALESARQAVAVGITDSGFLVLTGSLLEEAGKLDEAEGILQRLPGGG